MRWPWKRACRFIILILAYGGGAGCAPAAPGTVGSLAALVIGYLIRQSCTLTTFLSGLLLLTVLSIPICGKAARYLNHPDPKSIVLDEFVGMWYAISYLPSMRWPWFLSALLLFRFFDVCKPACIGWADRRIKGGLGIVIDDVLAGICTVVSLNLLAYLL